MSTTPNRRLKKAAGWTILTTIALSIIGTVVWLNVQFGFHPSTMVGAGQDWAAVIDALLMFAAGAGLLIGLAVLVVSAIDWVSE